MMPRIRLEIGADGPIHSPIFTESNSIRRGQTYKTESGLQVTLADSLERRGIEFPALATYLIDFESDFALGALADWLYQKFKAARVRVARINDQYMDVDSRE